jgi:hypothetical protein
MSVMYATCPAYLIIIETTFSFISFLDSLLLNETSSAACIIV